MVAKGVMRAIGCMSGTSLDGVDVALLETDGSVISAIGESAYRPYSDDERSILRAALGKWPGDTGATAAAEVVVAAHQEVLSDFLTQVGQVDLVGFHGQTLAHDPGGRGTHQAGDGAALARMLKLPVVWDFRSADVQMGGQGAPLAPAYHFALAQKIGAEASVAVLNLGGVGNLTWINPSAHAPEDPGALMAFDTGPANAPINDLMRARLGVDFDQDGALAAKGHVDAAVLDRFAAHGYFLKMPPKSLDRDDFSQLKAEVAELSDADAAATLTAVAAVSVVRGVEHFPTPVRQVLVAGGGRHNPIMMEMIAAGLGLPVVPIEEVGLDGDMIEAQAFAHLAVRVLTGLPTSFPGTTGVAAAIGGGEVSRPV